MRNNIRNKKLNYPLWLITYNEEGHTRKFFTRAKNEDHALSKFERKGHIILDVMGVDEVEDFIW